MADCLSGPLLPGELLSYRDRLRLQGEEGLLQILANLDRERTGHRTEDSLYRTEHPVHRTDYSVLARGQVSYVFSTRPQ